MESKGTADEVRALRKELSARKKAVKKELVWTEKALGEAIAAKEAKAAAKARAKGVAQCPEKVLEAYDGDFDSYKNDFVAFRYTSTQQRTFGAPGKLLAGHGSAPPTGGSSAPSTAPSTARSAASSASRTTSRHS